MSSFRRFYLRLLSLFRSDRQETDLAREIGAHLQLLEDRFIAQGMRPADARSAARCAFGGVEQTKEHHRHARGFRALAGWKMDLKLGARLLVKSPGLTIIGVIALAVAIGGGAAYFEFVNDFVRPTLPFPGGDRFIGIVRHDLAKNVVDGRTAYEFHEWRGRLRTIEELGAARILDQNLTTADGRVEPVRGVAVSAVAFRIIGTVPLLGRPLLDQDEQPGAPPVVVIGQDVWRARFDSDPAVLGTIVRLGNASYAVVGVMPGSFAFPSSHNLWTPLQLTASLQPGEGPAIKMFGRLAPGASLAAAQTEIEAAMKGIAATSGTTGSSATGPQSRTLVKPFVESLRSRPDVGLQLTFLYSLNLCFVALLGVCGANVATLVFARTATREGEITIRTALGAGRGRIVAQLSVEALVLTSISAVIGLFGASWMLRWVRFVWNDAQDAPLPFWWNERLGTETVLYAGVLTVLAALLVGALPALKATGVQMQGRLKEAGSTGGTMRFGRLWTGVIVTQVALTIVFLMSTVAFGWEVVFAQRTFDMVAFPREHVVVARAELLPANDGVDRIVESKNSLSRAVHEIEQRLAQDPAVAIVTAATRLPGMGHEEFWLEFAQPDIAAAAKSNGDVLWVGSTSIAPNYFNAFNQPVVAGRAFTQSDVDAARSVAIVDETFVRLVLGGRNPIGQLVRQPAGQTGGAPGPWLEIVGVVKDMSLAPNKVMENAMLYRPLGTASVESLRIMVRATTDANAAANALRAAAAAVGPELRLADVMTIDRLAEQEARTIRFFLTATGIVGAVALLLSTAGIYALVSFTLARRTREIGIRTALGASPRQIVTDILSRAIWQVGLGVLIGSVPGMALLFAASESARGLWESAGATIVVAVFVILVAMVSCVVPVRRALRIEPTQALRADS